MQSSVHECAFKSDANMLISAPTGAGKTNIAAMAMLRAISHTLRKNSSRNNSSSEVASFHVHAIKMVYIAPMKALVQEVVRTFT